MRGADLMYLSFSSAPAVWGYASVVGRKEFDGPLGPYFDAHSPDDLFGMPTYEKAESEMQHTAFQLMQKKAGVRDRDIGVVFAGDLLNQCAGSSYGLRDFDVPYLGLYGACSTMAEGILLAACMTDRKITESAAAVSSSHFCTAERQYRFPLEYGGQRPPTAQWTVSGCGAVLLHEGSEKIRVADGMVGRVQDLGITDANNMGAAMAPAAVDTMARYFSCSGYPPESFDAILTGDLGAVGHAIVKEQMTLHGAPITDAYNDCGLLIYNAKAQDVHSGGSGCGCSAAVLCSLVFTKMNRGEWKNVLFIGTGALMNPASLLQGESIPGIAHAVHFSVF